MAGHFGKFVCCVKRFSVEKCRCCCTDERANEVLKMCYDTWKGHYQMRESVCVSDDCVCVCVCGTRAIGLGLKTIVPIAAAPANGQLGPLQSLQSVKISSAARSLTHSLDVAFNLGASSLLNYCPQPFCACGCTQIQPNEDVSHCS